MSKFIFISLFLLASQAAFADTLTVDVFTTSQLSLTHSVTLNPLPNNAMVHIFKLDLLTKLQRGLNQSVKSAFAGNDKNAAIKTEKAWVNTHRSAYLNFSTAIQQLYQDHIQEIPAIVFNHCYIVLGTMDLNRAYQLYLNEVGGGHE